MLILNSVILLVLINLINVFCLGISNILLARFLGPAEYGVYSFIISFLIWIELLLISGIPQGINRYTVSHRNDSLLILKAGNILTAFISISLFIFFTILSIWLIRIFKLDGYGFIFIISFLDIFFYGFYFNYFKFQNGLFNFDKEFIIKLVYSLSRLFCILILLYLLKSVLAGILSNILASIFGLLAGICICHKTGRVLNINFENTKEILNAYLNKIIKYSIPTTLFILSFSLITNIDLWMIKYLYKNETLGFYGCAKFVAMSLIFISYGFSTALFPQFVKNFKDKNMGLFNHHIKQTLKVHIVLLIPAVIILTFYSKYFVKIMFGERFLPSAHLLNILLMAYWFLGIYFFFSNIFLATEKNCYIPIAVSSILVVCQILLTKVLLNFYSEKGVALAVVLVGIIGTIIYLFLINKIFRNFKGIFPKKMLISIIMSGIIVFILKATWTKVLFLNIMITILLFSLYLLICIVFKIIKKEDVYRIKAIFASPSKMESRLRL
jgi:O-antigen/teichoic acid export membrane protein